LEDNNLDDAIYAIGYEVFGLNFLIGTGFRAHFTDVIWTNAHVAEGLSDVISILAILNPTPFAVKSGTLIGGSDTHILSTFFTHPSYDGTTLSPDVAVLLLPEPTTSVPEFLPREFASSLRVGQPIATMGFPGEIEALNTTVPIASFKDGTISALRPFNPSTTDFAAANNKFVQHNLDLSGGTSGSPIFDHQGWIIAINNSGTESLVIDQNTGAPSRVPTGNIGFGVRVDEVWVLIDFLTANKPVALQVGSDRRDRPNANDGYLSFPFNWDGTTILP
jgi:S1-C subfamily serine protease